MRSARSRIGGLTLRNADPAVIAEARADLKAIVLREQITQAVAGWPPLTDAARVELAALLHPGDATP